MTTGSPVLRMSTITQSAATELAANAVAAAAGESQAVSVAVCDAEGTLKAFARMDGAPRMSVEVAQDKAYTAIGFGLSGDGWADLLAQDEPLRNGAASVDRLVPFGGSYPITHAGAVIGAIGVSGGHHSQDMRVAEEALRASSLSATGLEATVDAADGEGAEQ